MTVELINTGSELLLGRTLNTHQQWLCRRLSDLGYAVTRQVCVEDTRERICTAVREALSRAEVVIVTGGLGPTSDDLTREGIAELLNLELREDPEVVRRLEAVFRSFNRAMPPQVRVQAQVPVGAIVLSNAVGTAPGLAIPLASNPFRSNHPALLILLPGPPRELRPMFIDSVVPLLGDRFPPGEPFVCHTLRTTGIPESMAQARIDVPLRSRVEQGLGVGYCARPGEVDIRLSARGLRASELVSGAMEIVRQAMAGGVYAEGDVELEQAVVELLAARKLTLAIAESCTGGLIGHRVTNVPGASNVLKAGIITYANEAKQQWLGVPADLIASQGAVSSPVAQAMAEGVRRSTGADLGVAVTGIAGPSGGSEDKPVGTVFLGLASAEQTVVLRRRNPFDRATFKQVTSQQALDLVRRQVLALPLE
ncbi:MAG: competence/damage-inducible protein A [Verrucomicrobia bacterium]|nr:competence/damage-inducible protein A [Verrucomicrobiota bacterium]